MHIFSLKAFPFYVTIKLMTIILTFLLSFLTTSCYSRQSSQCHGPSLGIVICYVRCFHEIGSLIKNKTDVTDMIVYASGTQCDFLRAEGVFSQFAHIERLHFSGLQCPFGQLSSMRQIQLHFIRSQERIIKDIDFSLHESQIIQFPDLITLEMAEICCGLLNGYAEAPLLQNLTILCPDLLLQIDGMPDKFSTSKYKTGLLYIQAPLLRRVEMQESSFSFFPTASVRNLPALHSLFIKACKFCLQTPKSIPTPSNLSALSTLVFYQDSSSIVPMFVRLNTVCAQIGSSRVQFLRLLNSPKSGVSCTSLWQCNSCGLSETEADILYADIVSTNRLPVLTPSAPSQVTGGPKLYEEPILPGNRRQIVEIFLRSSSETLFSNIIPGVSALNTTDLEMSHSPALIMDKGALIRLPHLRRLEVKKAWGEAPGNGITRLLGNPFEGLPNPDKLRILRLRLHVCGCGEYRVFKWLGQCARKLRASLYCHRVLEMNRTDIGDLENRWITQTELIDLWAPFCEDFGGRSTVLPRNLGAVPVKQKTSGGKVSILDWTCGLSLIFLVYVNELSSYCL
uniref:Uncharacterized protein n=1 Tax=Schistocephalus solidus TaxID=70667 RepID=A0A0X3P5X6_SCHSO